MNVKLKKSLRTAAFRMWRFYITRKETAKATRMWRRGVKECIRSFKEIKGARFYLWFDETSMSFFSIVHKEGTKGNPLSMEYLQRTHKIKAKRTMKVEDMKRECFYYTPSQSNAIGCEYDNKLRTEKYHKWLYYYMTKLSDPMKKLNSFQP